MSPESREPTVFAIAGQTSTGKTRFGEGIVGELREQHFDACVISVGDIFRLLTMHTALQDNQEAMSNAAQETLYHTHIEMDQKGKILLHYNGESFKQTYENGNSAAPLTTNTAVMHHVDRFIADRLTAVTSGHDFIGLDGRERRGAHILFRTYADEPTRVAIRRIERPDECASMTDEAVYADIAKRDSFEWSFVQALLSDDVNVVHIDRTSATPLADRHLVERAVGVLVDFREGRMPANFGTINIKF